MAEWKKKFEENGDSRVITSMKKEERSAYMYLELLKPEASGPTPNNSRSLGAPVCHYYCGVVLRRRGRGVKREGETQS